MIDRLRIAIPLFPQFTALDAIGPLRSAAAHPDLRHHLHRSRQGRGTRGQQMGGGSAMFDLLTVDLRRLCRIGTCPGRRPGHMIGARLWEGHFTRGWLFCWLWCGVNIFEKLNYQSGRPDLNRRPLDPSREG